MPGFTRLAACSAETVSPAICESFAGRHVRSQRVYNEKRGDLNACQRVTANSEVILARRLQTCDLRPHNVCEAIERYRWPVTEASFDCRTKTLPSADRQLPKESASVPALERIEAPYPLPTEPVGQANRLWQHGANSAQHRVARQQSYLT